MKRIVITGAGIVSAIGIGRQATLENLLREQSGIGPMQILHSAHTELPVGEVLCTDDQLRELLNYHEPATRATLLGLLAAREAYEDALLDADLLSRTAFISGTTVGGMDTTERDYLSWLNGDHNATISLHEAGVSTNAIADALGKTAFATTISTACSSALNALICGANMLQLGQFDCVIAGGTECLTKFHLNGFNSLMILDHEPCRPFDDTRAGLNLGEGAAYLVMETEEHALQRGATILAYISGYANACDAFHQTASSENGEGAFLAMTQALQMAGVQPSEVDYVNAHGTATPNNDQSESAALMRVFGDTMPAVSSTKSLTGHTTSASGAIETVICLICMEYGFAPANVNFHTPMTNGIRPLEHNTQMTLNHVLCNSFAFGGNDSSLLLSKHPQMGNWKSDTDEIGRSKNTRVEIIDLKPETGNLKPENQYIPAMEARRMTEPMRRAIVAARQVLEQAGLDAPDAIITGTEYGCITNTLQFLDPLCREGEEGLKPTAFMQSTHNTVASIIARQLQCHGYNATFSHGPQSFEHACLDAQNLLQLGIARSVLVVGFDEADERWQNILAQAGKTITPLATARLYIINQSTN